jgi:hypothetical protein
MLTTALNYKISFKGTQALSGVALVQVPEEAEPGVSVKCW